MSPRHRQVRELLLSIDRGRGSGIGRQIEAQLRETISAGRLPVGTPLPSSRVLAEDLAVSRGVVTRAYRQLAAEGYISLRQGANPCVNGFTPAPGASAQPLNRSAEKYRFDLRADLPDLASFPRSGWLRAQQRALQSASTRGARRTSTAPAFGRCGQSSPHIWEGRAALLCGRKQWSSRPGRPTP